MVTSIYLDQEILLETFLIRLNDSNSQNEIYFGADLPAENEFPANEQFSNQKITGVECLPGFS